MLASIMGAPQDSHVSGVQAHTAAFCRSAPTARIMMKMVLLTIQTTLAVPKLPILTRPIHLPPQYALMDLMMTGTGSSITEKIRSVAVQQTEMRDQNVLTVWTTMVMDERISTETLMA